MTKYVCRHCRDDCLAFDTDICFECMYSLCKKPVDEALLAFKCKQYCLDQDDFKFFSWFNVYFGL